MTDNDRTYLSAAIRQCATSLYGDRGRFWGPSITLFDRWRNGTELPMALTIVRAWLGYGYGQLRADDRPSMAAGWDAVLADLDLTVPSNAMIRWARKVGAAAAGTEEYLEQPVSAGWLTNGERSRDWYIHHDRWTRGMVAIARRRELRMWAPVKRAKCGRPVFGWRVVGVVETLELR